MGFLAPVALAAALTAMIPVLIHLLTNRAAKRRTFPALAFLRRAHAGQARLKTLRDLIVLILRTLAIGLLVLGLAGLYWTGEHRGGRAPVVVVLDASASMQQRDRGVTVFTHAVAAAHRLADELSNRPMLLLVAGQPMQRSSLQPVLDRGPYRALLNSAEPGWSAGATVSAVSTALDILRDGGDCYVITDGSRTALSGIDVAAIPSAVALTVMHAGGGGANQAIKAIAVEPGVAMVGRPCTLSADVGNYADKPAQVTIALALGTDRRVQQVTIPAGESLSISQSFTPGLAGEALVEAAIVSRDAGVDDVLTGDDRRIGVLSVREQQPVLVYSDGNRTRVDGALRPVVAALQAAGLVPELHTGAQLPRMQEPSVHSREAVVVTVGINFIQGSSALTRHLLEGGALVQFLASDVDAALVRSLDSLEPPLVPLPPMDLSNRQRGVRLNEVHGEHPLLRAVQGREPLLRQVEAWRYRPATLTSGAQNLLSWEDGSIAMAERRVGSGRWIVINISPSDADSNLAALDVMPLLLAQLGQVLQPQRRDDCALPSGSVIDAPTAVTRVDGGVVPIIDGQSRLSEPGLYRQADTQIAVAIPAGEADLRQIPNSAVERTTDVENAMAAVSLTPLWPWCLFAVLVLFMLELLIASRRPRVST